jgi:hypothetical protein
MLSSAQSSRANTHDSMVRIGCGMDGRYMLIISLAFFVFTGAVGFYSCFFFVRKIYGSVKVD